jgi:hypothetical protein
MTSGFALGYRPGHAGMTTIAATSVNRVIIAFSRGIAE